MIFKKTVQNLSLVQIQPLSRGEDKLNHTPVTRSGGRSQVSPRKYAPTGFHVEIPCMVVQRIAGRILFVGLLQMVVAETVIVATMSGNSTIFGNGVFLLRFGNGVFLLRFGNGVFLLRQTKKFRLPRFRPAVFFGLFRSLFRLAIHQRCQFQQRRIVILQKRKIDRRDRHLGPPELRLLSDVRHSDQPTFTDPLTSAAQPPEMRSDSGARCGIAAVGNEKTTTQRDTPKTQTRRGC